MLCSNYKENYTNYKEKKRESYNNMLPTRRAVRRWIESFALLSFTDMAESIDKAKEKKQVVTFGSDDTVKA